jgi:hypothetical protein
MTTNALEPMMQFATPLPPLCEMLVSTWDENIGCTSFNHIQLFSLTSRHSAKYGIRTLADVVIADPIQTNLFPRSCAIQGFAISNAAQAKERSYCN